jgi:predicted acyl esterase
MRLILDRDVPVEMRDGTVLRADVYRPESDAPWPVLLQRTPYDKNVPRISALLLNPVPAASAGYAVVVQDVRGRFASEGDFYTFRHEPDDGYDTEVYAYTIDLWATSNVFQAGHRIRLEISSSNFPRFDRNPNTGGVLATETTLLPAIQTIHHDGTYPSHVTLPIIPRT